LLLWGSIIWSSAAAQSQLPYEDPSLPIPARVNDLLARMTPD